jgi:lipoate-protein ligase A
MAVDEALMDFARRGVVTLRFYTWEPYCLSLGRNQLTGPSAPPAAPDFRLGEDVVRRPTGGRSVYHGPELTYSLTAPDRFHGGPRAIYVGVNRAIRGGLVALGAAIDPAADPTIDRPGAAPLGPAGCFRDPAPGELTARGRKLVGSAQWRHAGAILQHGSILLHNRQERGTLEGVDLEAGRAAIGVAELLSRPLDEAELIAALRDSFETELNLPASAMGHNEDVAERAGRLEAKYRSADWTWRR